MLAYAFEKIVKVKTHLGSPKKRDLRLLLYSQKVRASRTRLLLRPLIIYLNNRRFFI